MSEEEDRDWYRNWLGRRPGHPGGGRAARRRGEARMRELAWYRRRLAREWGRLNGYSAEFAQLVLMHGIDWGASQETVYPNGDRYQEFYFRPTIPLMTHNFSKEFMLDLISDDEKMGR